MHENLERCSFSTNTSVRNALGSGRSELFGLSGQLGGVSTTTYAMNRPAHPLLYPRLGDILCINSLCQARAACVVAVSCEGPKAFLHNYSGVCDTWLCVVLSNGHHDSQISESMLTLLHCDTRNLGDSAITTLGDWWCIRMAHVPRCRCRWVQGW